LEKLTESSRKANGKLAKRNDKLEKGAGKQVEEVVTQPEH